MSINTKNLGKAVPAFAALFSLTVFAVSANIIPSILFGAAGDFGISPELMSGATTIQFAGFIAATIAGGILADRVGKKAVFLAACLLTVAGAALWYFAGSLGMIFFGSLATGMGGGILESMSSALLSDLFPARRKLFLNLSQAAYCIGAASGPYLIGTFLGRNGMSWRTIFVLLAAMAAVLLIFFAISRIPKSGGEEVISIRILKRIMKSCSFACPCATIFLYVFAETAHMIFINYYLQRRFGAPETWAVWGLSIFWIAMTAGRVLCAFIKESASYRTIIALLMFVSGIAMFSQAFARQWQTSLALFAATGFVFSGIWPLIIGYTAKINPGYSGTVIGITVASGAMGTLVAAPVMGLCFSLFPLAYGFAIASSAMFAGSLLIFFMKER